MSDRTIKLTKPLALALWNEALEHELGLKIEIDPTQLEAIRRTFYEARTESQNPDLDALSVIVGPDAKELWLVKKTVEAP